MMAAELRARCVRVADGFHIETMLSEWKIKM
jgi:hypothetical protein